jgi:cell division protease FtsH
MAQALIKYETLTEDQLKEILAGREPRPPADWDDSTPVRPSKPQDKPGPAIGTTPAGQT